MRSPLAAWRFRRPRANHRRRRHISRPIAGIRGFRYPFSPPRPTAPPTRVRGLEARALSVQTSSAPSAPSTSTRDPLPIPTLPATIWFHRTGKFHGTDRTAKIVPSVSEVRGHAVDTSAQVREPLCQNQSEDASSQISGHDLPGPSGVRASATPGSAVSRWVIPGVDCGCSEPVDQAVECATPAGSAGARPAFRSSVAVASRYSTDQGRK